jgi:adenylylsulfate kinase
LELESKTLNSSVLFITILMISRSEKEKFLNQKSVVIWMTGLSGSGKTTLAEDLEEVLFRRGYLVQILDGDNIRSGVNRNLGFSEQDREENIRRVAEISRLFLDCGIICINCFISPTQKIRQKAKEIIGSENFIEVFLNASIDICEKRDVKGLYIDARAGKIKNFTGIDSPYEIPANPDIEINTEVLSVEESVEKCMSLILHRLKVEEK